MKLRMAIVSLLWVLGLSAAAEEIQKTEDLSTQTAAPGFSEQTQRVSETVTLAGKVDLAQLAAQYPDGVLLIDLRTAPEGVELEAQQAAQLAGVHYENLPVAGAKIDPAQLRALDQLLAERESQQPVVIHCASGNRAGMMWGALQIDAGGDVDEVLESLPIVDKDPVKDALKEYAGADER